MKIREILVVVLIFAITIEILVVAFIFAITIAAMIVLPILKSQP